MFGLHPAVDRIDRHGDGRLARAVGRLGRLARASAYAAAVMLVVSGATGADDPPASKKVGTERIVVDPKAPTPAVEIPHGTAPAPAPSAPAAPAGPRPEVQTGTEALPPPVAAMRKRLLETAYSGDLERLRKVIQSNEMPPIFSINEIGDPIDYIKSQSGDGKGLELLAILTDVLEASWVRLNPGTPQEMYVWPSFAALPLDDLPPGRVVELYKIVTSSDLEEMRSVGRYTFYTVGIGPDGTWHWFKLAD
ncbi:hypothetical protein EYW49_18460 [Siculibacillus lacustris]|uniref:Uncharacterized protein n=1 Tax=Siculibacillus lacustris TaxID=1549641 RepID=A0A4Q9VJ72_9HYPH|nr:hypothetical protein [Siculibacillus lacustris]TBW34422.1 hypothetical protein EYW49_18460 [Siculibacillus lacustris]